MDTNFIIVDCLKAHWIKPIIKATPKMTNTVIINQSLNLIFIKYKIKLSKKNKPITIKSYFKIFCFNLLANFF